MAIETLDDIVEELADLLYVYGDDATPSKRMDFVTSLKRRIRNAVEIERQLARGKQATWADG